MNMPKIAPFNLRTKLIVLYFLTIFIPLLVSGQAILSISGKKIVEQTTRLTRESSAQTARNIQERFGGYVDIVSRLSVDQTLINYLNPARVYASELEVIDAYDLYLKPVTFYDFNHKDPAARLNILFMNKTFLQDSNIYIFADDDIRERADFKAAVEAGGSLVWGETDQSVFVARSFYSTDRRLVGVISMQFPESILYSLIGETQFSDRTLIVADRSGQVISSNDRNLVGTSVSHQSYFRPEAAQPFEVKGADGKETYTAIVHALGDGSVFPDWRLITLITLDRLIDDERNIRKIGLWVLTLALLVSCGIFIFALGRITERVKRLVRKMQTVKNGELSVMEDEGSQDEIGAMTRNFNGMIEHLQRSIYENYEVNLKLKDITIKKQEAELYALQNQIHPHFLFNTLETIRMSLHNKGDRETATIVLHFANLFRYLLHWQGEFIPLRDEIDLVKKYLTIQKYRFGDRLHYELKIEDGLTEALIPKLTIQPLVENAVKHGVESVRTGRIRIRVQARGADAMAIAIQDNGAGIPPETRKRIQEELSDPEMKKSGSIGLKNVQDRVQLHYGASYGIALEQPAEGGTCVSVTMPIRLQPASEAKE